MQPVAPPRMARRYTAFMTARPEVLVQKLHPEAHLPQYAHMGPWGDLAADLYANEASTLQPGETAAVSIGLALGLPEDFGALIEDRSGLALRGITTLAGVIDPGYRGEIKVVMINLSAEPYSISAGARIAQLRLVRRIEAAFSVVDSLEATTRGQAGFGSTGS